MPEATEVKLRTPTMNQKKVFDKVKKQVENGGTISVSKAIKEAGLSAAIQRNPHKITKSKGWAALMKEFLPEKLIAKRHAELLNSNVLDHQVFATGPRDEEARAKLIEADKKKAELAGKEYEGYEYLTDGDIKELLLSVNCTVRKIVHRDTARDVYFWSPNDNARKSALAMFYQITGRAKFTPNPEASKVEITQIIIVNPDGGTDNYNTTNPKAIRSISETAR